MEKVIVQVRGLVKAYPGGVRALDGIDLDICEGEWVSIMGPSGSGKSTLLNLIGGLDRPRAGSVVVAGADLGQLSNAELARFRRNTVGFVFQQFHLVPYLTALENVMLAQYFHSVTDEVQARDALEKVGLGDRLRHLPSQLSGGELQRVCLARALINQPRLILADEPTGNLDAFNEAVVLGLFSQFHHQGYTLVVVTHDPEVADMGERMVYMEHGRTAREIPGGKHPLPPQGAFPLSP
ncbi:MAG: ABC transporter ATP-binding protein [Chloroflexota bacterium]